MSRLIQFEWAILYRREIIFGLLRKTSVQNINSVCKYLMILTLFISTVIDIILFLSIKIQYCKISLVCLSIQGEETPSMERQTKLI